MSVHYFHEFSFWGSRVCASWAYVSLFGLRGFIFYRCWAPLGCLFGCVGPRGLFHWTLLRFYALGAGIAEYSPPTLPKFMPAVVKLCDEQWRITMRVNFNDQHYLHIFVTGHVTKQRDQGQPALQRAVFAGSAKCEGWEDIIVRTRSWRVAKHVQKCAGGERDAYQEIYCVDQKYRRQKGIWMIFLTNYNYKIDD